MIDPDHKNSADKLMSVIILAGGKSSRMNAPKVWLPIYDQTTFLQHTIRLYRNAAISNLVVVINSEFCQQPWKKYLENLPDAVKIVPNNDPEAGRIHSIQLGLEHVKKSEFVFIHNIDNPMVSGETLIHLKKKRCYGAVTIPMYLNKTGHPIVLESDLLKSRIDQTSQNDTLKDLLNSIPKNIIQVNDPGILANINTPDDYLKMLNGLVA